MIRIHRRQLEHLCESRGYMIADAMPCVVAQDGDRWTIDETHRAYPRRRQEWRPIPLGDVVEKALTRIGITKDRVERWTRTAGTPGGCGCDARQKWLNEWGNEKQRKLRSVLLKARRFYVGS